MGSDKAWRSTASQVLDDYERGAIKERLTQADVAKRAGVSRQTLWRDAPLRQRFLKIQEMRSRQGTSSVTRANSDMRIRRLQGDLEQLQRENGLLVQNIVAICRKLREHGLDPRVFVGEAAEDARQACVRFLVD